MNARKKAGDVAIGIGALNYVDEVASTSLHTVRIERMAYSPEAVGHLPNGKIVFVEGAAPGDVAEVEVFEDRKTFARGRIAKLVEASPNRVNPASPTDLLCGTAPWQHLSYEAQLKAKRANVLDALIRTAKFEIERAESLVEACIPSKREWGYRNKLEIACANDEEGRFITGFHKEGSDELIAADSSKLAHKQIEKAPKALCGAIRYAQGSRDLGIYRIGVRHSLATGALEVALWTKPGPFPRALFAKTIASACKPTGIIRVLAEPGKARKIKGVEVLDGHGRWHERIGEVEFATQAPSFFQVNTAQATKLVDIVLEDLGDVNGAYVADLYAGGGTFSVPLALAGAEVVAVESAGSSVRDLRVNAEDNGVDIEIVGGDAARELEMLGELDALVVDPPRSGLAESVIGDIATAKPGRVVYVSCNPSTWARDVARLEEQGYKLIAAKPLDMFPQTYHVEIASFFEPA